MFCPLFLSLCVLRFPAFGDEVMAFFGSATSSMKEKDERQRKSVALKKTKSKVGVKSLIAKFEAMITELQKENAELKAMIFGKTKEELHQDEVERWTEVKSKKKKKEESASVSVSSTMPSSSSSTMPFALMPSPTSTLCASDWSIPVLKVEQVDANASGVVLVTQAQANKIYEQLRGNNFLNVTGQLAILSPAAIDAAEGASRPLTVKIKTQAGRLDTVRKFLTDLGSTPVKAKSEGQSEFEKYVLAMPNNTVRIVVQMSRTYMKEVDYHAARNSPNMAFKWWANALQIEKAITYSSMAQVKTTQDLEWIESVITVPKDRRDEILMASGARGVFTKPFLSKDVPDDTHTKILWLQPETSLDDALVTLSHVSMKAFGLVSGRRGLGLRIRQNLFHEVARLILPAREATEEIKRSMQRLFEITKVPPWVNFDDLKETMKGGVWAWDIELVKEVRQFGKKLFVVRALQDPPRDCAIVNNQWMPIQPAKEQPRAKVQTMTFTKKEQPKKESEVKNVPPKQGQASSTAGGPSQRVEKETAYNPNKMELPAPLANCIEGLFRDFLKKQECYMKEFRNEIDGRCKRLESRFVHIADDDSSSEDEEMDEVTEDGKLAKRKKMKTKSKGKKAKTVSASSI